MDATHLQKHTLSYITLFIGSGMFVFYQVRFSIFIVVTSIIVNIFFFYFNSILSIDEIMVNGGLLTLSVAIFSILLIRMRYQLTKRELIARYALEASSNELRKKNKNIVDSINYAKRIQNAVIPSTETFNRTLPDSFVFYQPKDIVSGDFYWVKELRTTPAEPLLGEKLVVFCVADCTGHGVPGAFMSLIGLKILNQSVSQRTINSPADALDYLSNEIYNTVNQQDNNSSIIRDGMDLALCAINYEKLELTFSGAKNPVYIIRDQQLIELKGDKKPIGSYPSNTSFTNHHYQLQKNDMIYIFSDGYVDQFGGPQGRKFMYKPFKKLLSSIAPLPIKDQQNTIQSRFYEWKGNIEQLDDVCVIGVRI